MELAAGCTTIELQENMKGQTEVVARVINRWTGGETSSEGIAVVSKKNPAIFQYKVNSILPTVIARLLPGAGSYQVLSTDYDNFAILYTCSSLGLLHTGNNRSLLIIIFLSRLMTFLVPDQVWVLGRTREISVSLRAQIYSVLNELGIDSDRLIISKNNNCPEH